MNSFFSQVSLAQIRSLSALSLGLLILTPAALAQPRPAKPASFVFTPPSPPKNQGAPKGRRQGGASRSTCTDYAGLTAIVPVQDGVVRGLTTSPQPTLWFYMPSPINPDLGAEFVLQDLDNNVVYQTPLNFNTDSPGIVPVSVKAPEPTLQTDHSYKWTLSLYCDPLRPSSSVYVKGLLEAAAPKNSSNQDLSAFEQAAQAAQNGLWFDSLTALGELRQAEPNNSTAEQAWIELLEQIELEDLASAPLLSLGF